MRNQGRLIRKGRDKKEKKKWKAKGEKGRKKKKPVKYQLNNFACGTHLKFAMGKIILLKILGRGKKKL